MLPLAQFNSFINSNHLFTPQSKVLAAVSGGMDSVFMATLLHAAGYDFGIAHCNFQLRSDEALQDEQFCKNLAETLGVPFYHTRFDTENYAAENKLSIQMAARALRYHWFEQLRQQNGYDVIALAHHQNDTVETILLNLTRGTGIAGLHGIRAKNGYLVRPLLFMTRDEVATNVKAHNITYREDSSNASDKYARNKIRHQVVPALKELNPNLEQTFNNEARYFAELEQLLASQVAKTRAGIVRTQGDEIRLNIRAARRLDPLKLLLYGLLAPYNFTDTTVADIVSVLNKHAGRTFESATHKLVLDRDDLIITPLAGKAPQTLQLSLTDAAVNFGRFKLTLITASDPQITSDPNRAAIEADKLQYPLALRTWQQGDTFYPLGMKTRKKLSDFFISQKVPLHKKADIPLLINGNGDIIWVCGYRISDRYKISPATKKISIFELTEL